MLLVVVVRVLDAGVILYCRMQTLALYAVQYASIVYAAQLAPMHLMNPLQVHGPP